MTTIALVEEDDVTRLHNARILRQAGFRVVEQRTTERLMTLLTVERPALLLLDRSLGGESGFAACARVKASPSVAETRVVIMSAPASFDDMRFAAVAGAQRVLPKPLPPETIVRMLAR